MQRFSLHAWRASSHGGPPARHGRHLLPCAAMADSKLRVGFVGAGNNTRRHHIPKLKAQPGVELTAVANRSKESGERVAKEFGIARVHGDWRGGVAPPAVAARCTG